MELLQAIEQIVAKKRVEHRRPLLATTIEVAALTGISVMEQLKMVRRLERNGIVDIKMRMLKVPELKKIMGFPEDYVLVGSQADQKKFIGNAVEVTIARAWCEALCEQLSRTKIKNIA